MRRVSLGVRVCKLLGSSYNSNQITTVSPSCSDMLNTCASGILICSTVSFRIIGAIPSASGDLFSCIWHIAQATTSWVTDCIIIFPALFSHRPTFSRTFCLTQGKRYSCVFLYSTVCSPLDRPKRFTLHPRADLFIPTPTQLIWEVF